MNFSKHDIEKEPVKIKRKAKYSKKVICIAVFFAIYVFGCTALKTYEGFQFIKSLRVDFRITSVMAGN